MPRPPMAPRDRVASLLDPDSFLALDAPAAGDGLLAGRGLVAGRAVCVYAHDPTVRGGSLGAAGAETIVKLMDMALREGAPVVALCDGGGPRVQEGVAAVAGLGAVLRAQSAARGRVPQLCAVLGPCVGGGALVPPLADLVWMTADTACLYVTGPEVVAAVTGARVTPTDLGGPSVYAGRTGPVHRVVADDATCLAEMRAVLAMLLRARHRRPGGDDRAPDVPAQHTVQNVTAYALLALLADDGALLPISPEAAPNLVCALARLDGRAVGLLANDDAVLAGCLDVEACHKAAGFVGLCDRLGLPVVTIVDTPGFLPGLDQEQGGLAGHAAALAAAYATARVPRVTVLRRRAYGAAAVVLGSRAVGADAVYAWPEAEVAVMGAEGAVAVLHAAEIAASPDPDATRAALAAEYRRREAHPGHALARGDVDAVIAPNATRRHLVEALARLDRDAAG